MSTNNNNEGKPTPAAVSAANLSDMDTDAALLAIALERIPGFQQYPPDADEERKQDIDRLNVMAIKNHAISLVVNRPGKPKDDRKYGGDDDEEDEEEEELPEPTPAEIKAAELCPNMDYDDALLALQKGLVPHIEQYPPDATEKKKRDIDGNNALALRQYRLKNTVADLHETVTEAVAALDVAPSAAPAPAPTNRAPAPSLIQQALAQVQLENDQARADQQAELGQFRVELGEVQGQVAVLTETVADQGERLSTVEERLDRADAARSPPRRNPPRGKKGKGGKKQK